MDVTVEHVQRLRFDDGAPVRAASGLVRLGTGWLVAQDDSVHAAWYRSGAVRRLRLLPDVEGRGVFGDSSGTKHLKPDVEAACAVDSSQGAAVLLLGSGSAPRRTSAIVVEDTDDAQVTAADLAPLYGRIAAALGLGPGRLNLEGACPVGGVLRWFHRGGHDSAPASVDVGLEALVAAVLGRGAATDVAVDAPRRYDLGRVEGVPLTVTDAVALADGRVLVSAAGEDTPNAVDDGPVVATALALLDGDDVVEVAHVPAGGGAPHKIEGLALVAASGHDLALLAVVDEDDEQAASALLRLHVRDLPGGRGRRG